MPTNAAILQTLNAENLVKKPKSLKEAKKIFDEVAQQIMGYQPQIAAHKDKIDKSDLKDPNQVTQAKKSIDELKQLFKEKMTPLILKSAPALENLNQQRILIAEKIIKKLDARIAELEKKEERDKLNNPREQEELQELKALKTNLLSKALKRGGAGAAMGLINMLVEIKNPYQRKPDESQSSAKKVWTEKEYTLEELTQVLKKVSVKNFKELSGSIDAIPEAQNKKYSDLLEIDSGFNSKRTTPFRNRIEEIDSRLKLKDSSSEAFMDIEIKMPPLPSGVAKVNTPEPLTADEEAIVSLNSDINPSVSK